MSQYVLSATLEMRDKMTAAIKTAKKNVSGFKTSVVGSLSAVDRLTTANGRLAASAVKSAIGRNQENRQRTFWDQGKSSGGSIRDG